MSCRFIYTRTCSTIYAGLPDFPEGGFNVEAENTPGEGASVHSTPGSSVGLGEGFFAGTGAQYNFGSCSCEAGHPKPIIPEQVMSEEEGKQVFQSLGFKLPDE